MHLDPKIKTAIDQAVESAGQPDALAQRVAAWVQALIRGEDNLNDQASTGLHLELLYEAVQLSQKKGAQDDYDADSWLEG